MVRALSMIPNCITITTLSLKVINHKLWHHTVSELFNLWSLSLAVLWICTPSNTRMTSSGHRVAIDNVSVSVTSRGRLDRGLKSSNPKTPNTTVTINSSSAYSGSTILASPAGPVFGQIRHHLHLALDMDKNDEVTPNDVFLYVHTKDHDEVTFIDNRSTRFHTILLSCKASS
ncbi:hypothetical protein Syun_007510 [Stephania yunnanensis]|uniref:Uncharacterized protein n=1 Tax=Stephania yunnanensis TaxID=152371 RepID=A0AAP0Q0C1_9MAGN